MFSYLARRFLYMVPVLLIVTFVIFFFLYLIPGTFVENFCSFGCPGAMRDRLHEQYGLNDPFLTQYGRWIHGLVGAPYLDGQFPFLHIGWPSFGYSFYLNEPAFEALLGHGKWLWSLLLVLSAMSLSWLIAIPAGVYAATHKDLFSDRLLTFSSFLGMSVPGFILASFFIWLVSGYWRLDTSNPFFQLYGYLNPEYVGKPLNLEIALNFLWHFIPPVVILALGSTATVLMHTRGKMIEVLEMAFVQTARAKGVKERRVIRHALRNALTPLIGMLGFWIPSMLEGVIVVALLFKLPQVELSFLGALQAQNGVLVMAGLFVFTLVLLLGNLLSDALLALSDPRIRYE